MLIPRPHPRLTELENENSKSSDIRGAPTLPSPGLDSVEETKWFVTTSCSQRAHSPLRKRFTSQTQNSMNKRQDAELRKWDCFGVRGTPVPLRNVGQDTFPSGNLSLLLLCSSGAMETGWTWLLMTACQPTTISWFSPNPTTAMSFGALCWRRLMRSKATLSNGRQV